MSGTSSNLTCLLLCLLAACSPTSGTINYGSGNQETVDALIGEWRNTSLRITLNTANGTDGSEEKKYDESNWEEQFGMKPARTFFQENGSYYTEYRDLDDSVFQVAKGNWSVNGDSLIMEESDFTYRYRIRIQGETGEFTALIDGDEDGEWDDNYVEVQRKMK
jgi:hypothetical protein